MLDGGEQELGIGENGFHVKLWAITISQGGRKPT